MTETPYGTLKLEDVRLLHGCIIKTPGWSFYIDDITGISDIQKSKNKANIEKKDEKTGKIKVEETIQVLYSLTILVAGMRAEAFFASFETAASIRARIWKLWVEWKSEHGRHKKLTGDDTF